METKSDCFSLIIWSASAAYSGSPDAGRVALRTYEDKVVVHHGMALHPDPGDEFNFHRLGMDENHIGIALSANFERLPVPTAMIFTAMPVFCLKIGSR